MIRSMTGFGRGSGATDKFEVRVEVRTVNNRSLRTVFRLPERMQGLEQEFERQVREAITRGSVTVAVNLDDRTGETGYTLDVNAIAHYRDVLQSLANEPVPMGAVVSLPGVVRKKTVEEVPEDLANIIRESLSGALAELVASREKEGAFLWKDVLERCRVIEERVARVELRIPRMIEEYRKRLLERLTKLLEGVGGVRPEDLHREVALFADRSDITEEITRMRSHLALLHEGATAGEPFGRKLEFVTQEMFREANTMGSKSNDAEMVHDVLDIKAEVEKLREQALNVE